MTHGTFTCQHLAMSAIYLKSHLGLKIRKYMVSNITIFKNSETNKFQVQACKSGCAGKTRSAPSTVFPTPQNALWFCSTLCSKSVQFTPFGAALPTPMAEWSLNH
jgi:hypothetical protein